MSSQSGPGESQSGPGGSRSGGNGIGSRAWLRIRSLAHEAAKFGVVGLAALVVDVGVFNLLLYSAGSPLTDRPLTAKAISVTLATVVAYFGNRFWTFRDRGSLPVGRGYLVFFGLNAVAMAIPLAILGISHYLLGLTGPVADNVSANVIGLVLGTIFRFWAYRRFVFPEIGDEDGSGTTTDGGETPEPGELGQRPASPPGKGSVEE